MEHGIIKTESLILEETPEQAAQAISDALEFLRREAEAIGMCDVGELIGRACAQARHYRRSH